MAVPNQIIEVGVGTMSMVASAGAGVSGLVFGATALDPTADTLDRVIDGGASLILLTVAAASIYALLQGKIVPIAAFSQRLDDLEETVDNIAETQHEILSEVRKGSVR